MLNSPQEEPEEMLPLGRQIKRHWKTFRPNMYKELLREGTLDRLVIAAQEQTLQAYAKLIQSGLPDNQAWEMVREEWAFLPEE
jgi:hypothetical protein